METLPQQNLLAGRYSGTFQVLVSAKQEFGRIQGIAENRVCEAKFQMNGPKLAFRWQPSCFFRYQFEKEKASVQLNQYSDIRATF
ncbi:MAG: hypothetical protein OXK72_03975 [Gammaproteobacteria bacterium]|nr:hypothetical protein [Gammaproteobacteria bacterium]